MLLKPRKRARSSDGSVPKGLRPFKPGYDERRNIGGRPLQKYAQLREQMQHDLTESAPNHIAKPLGLPEGATWAECVSRRCLKMAALGDVQCMRLVHDVVDLQVALRVNVNSEASEKEMQELRAMFRAKVQEEAELLAAPKPLDIVPVEVKP